MFPDFNLFDFRRAFSNFVQIFIIGWITMVIIASQVGPDRPIVNGQKELSAELVFSPAFWLFPFCIAFFVSVGRGIRQAEIDFDDPKSVEAYYENRKFKNQPAWFKKLSYSLLGLFIYSALAPDREVSQEQYQEVQKLLSERNSEALNQKYEQLMTDGKLMGNELNQLKGYLFKLDMEKRKEDREAAQQLQLRPAETIVAPKEDDVFELIKRLE